jgi:filamentous hemagglutinin family protein
LRHFLPSIVYGSLGFVLGSTSPLLAQSVLPQGGSVAAGAASIGAPANNHLTITQSSQNAVVNWNSFSIGSSNTVTFNQPNSSSAILNRVTGGTPSTIAGTLQANGQVYLVNPNGIAITPSGTVNVGGGFVASTLGISNDDFMAGKRTFTGNGSSAAVSNAGTINVGRGGFVALLGGTVSNEGRINVPLGKVGLGSGESITLDLAGDGFMQVAVPTAATTNGRKALVDVSGRISAAGGSIELKAATVKQAIRDAVNVSGTLSARSISGHSGAIVLGGGGGGNVRVSGRINASTAGRNARATNGGKILIAGNNVTIADKARVKAASSSANGGAIAVTGAAVSIGSAVLDASGVTGGGQILIGGGLHGTGALAHADSVSIAASAVLRANATRDGDGGTVAVWSDGATSVKGLVSASAAGLGNGGMIETSGHDLNVAGIAVNASAPRGAAGTWLLDPYNLTVSGTATTAAQSPAGTWTSNTAGSVVLNTDINSVLNAGTNVVLQTSSTPSAQLGDLNVNAALSWGTNTTLTLIASNNINVNANITATGNAAGLVIGPNSANGTELASGTGVFNLNNNASITLSGTNPSLSIAGTPYTVINSLGTALDATVPPATQTLQGMASANLAGHYAIGSNIDATATSTWNVNTSFTPIGTVGVPFNGTFDGLGHTIGNLTINLPATADTGLFGSTGTASVIQNIGLIGGSVIALSSGGGLVGSNTGTIKNSFNTGTVSGGSSLGGLMGSNTGSVSNSYATGNVNGTSSLGGLMGSTTGSVSNSYATGNVSGTSSLGGLAGSGTTGAISNSYATGNVTGTSSVGGLLGSSTGPVIDSYATGAVSGTTSVGGLMGSSSGPVTDSYWNINTSGQTTSPGGTGLTSVQMQQQGNFHLWDFANTWTIYNGLTNPLLRSFMTPLAVTANHATKTYDGLAYSGGNGVIYSSPPTGNLLGTVGYSGTSQGAVNVGGYVITPAGLYSNQQGYIINYGNGTLTVAAAPVALTVMADAQTRIYGAANPTLTYVSTGLVNGDALTGQLATLATLTSNVGIYAITQGTLAASSNYTLTYIGANLTVMAAPLTVTVDAQNRIYGAANPSLSYVSAGLVNGDALSGGLATSATTTSNVGAYTIAQGTLAASANYALTYVGANLSVTAAPLTVTANVQSRAYGAANPALSYASSGLVNGDALSGGLTTTASTTSNVGAYAITQGSLAASSNYALSYVGTNLSVTAAPLTVTADAQSRAYGAANPTLSYGSTGLVNGDALTGVLATSANTPSNVGGYAITQGTLAASANYALSYVGANLTVTAAALTVTAGAQSRIYEAANPALTYVSTGLVNGDTLSGGLATTATVTSNVGAYAINQGNLVASSNYALSYVGANLSVTAATLTVTADAQSRFYGATNPALGYVSSGLLNGDTLSGGLSTSATTTSNVGAYAITQGTLAASANYALSYVGANLSVTAAPLTVTANAQSRSYGAANPALTYVSSGLVNGDTLSGGLATTATVTSNVGAYAINQGTLAASANYALSYVGANLTVTAAALTVTADAQSRLYGAANPALGYVSTGLLNGDTLSGGLASSATTTSNVGAYAITQGSLAASANYALNYVGANLTVTAAPLTVTADSQSRLYGTVNPALTYVSSGLLNGDALSGGLTTSATTASNVGSYGIAQGTLAASANYALSYVGANLTVAAAALTVTANAQSRLYGSANPALGYVSSGLLNGDTLSGGLTTTASTTSNVGAYAITQGTLAASSNYTLTYISANLAVTAAPLTVTADAQSRLYGSANPALTYVSSGLLNGDTLSGLLATSATITSNVGAYAIAQGTLANSNYAIAYTAANLAVTAAPLTVTADAQSRLYGAANRALGYISSGLLNGDTLSGGLTTTATTTSNVGAYAITQGSLAASANYALSYVGANLSVTAAPLTVAADAQSRIYGATNPSLSFVSSGLLNGDSLSGGLTTSATTISNVGAYAIAQGTLAASANYAMSYVGANLTVAAAPLTVTADAQSRLYGAANPALSYVSSGLVNGDTLSGGLATTANAASNVGSYAIIQGTLAASPNYALTYGGANLAVTAAPLTVTASAQSRLYGAANPALTYVSSGLLNSDSLSGLLTTSATTTSNVGSYGITQGSLANSNYTISYMAANLAVTAAPLTVTADTQSRLYGTANPALSFVSSGLLNGDSLSGGLTTSATTTSNVGAYAIAQGTLAASANYTFSYIGANLTVTAAPLTVIADAQSKIYGTSNPALSYASSGLVNGDALSGGLTTTATTNSNVGSYAIAQGTLTASANYALSYIGADLSVTAAPAPATPPTTESNVITADAMSTAFPSLFSPNDLSPNHADARRFASDADSLDCGSLQVLRSLNRHGLADLSGGTASCIRNFSETK